ncbi:MAG: SHOCT domain-containing protein [Deltaproteobacteria bacterium]|nr:SHOCT domain-containing protein [Deltaproteobacteria bacterium]
MSPQVKIRSFVMIVMALGLLQGCATIIHGTTQDVAITTDPAGAELVVDGRERYRSPAKITMKRKEDHVVEVNKAGFQKETVNIKSVLSGAVAGNIIAGGLIGWGVDAVSGGQYRLVPEHINLRLRPLGALDSGKETGFGDSLEEKLDQLAELKAKGKISADEYSHMRKSLLDKADKSAISAPRKEIPSEPIPEPPQPAPLPPPAAPVKDQAAPEVSCGP